MTPVILITVLFGPTQLILTTDAPPKITDLVEWDGAGNVSKINLPDRLVVMPNHQAYLDWIYMWILACYAGHARGIIILLKASLKQVPIVGWGMVRCSPLYIPHFSSIYHTRTLLTVAILQIHLPEQIVGGR